MADPPHADHLHPTPASLPRPTELDRIGAPLLTPLTPLVGREREVGAVGALLERTDVRLLTLTGPSGVGKTRLALAAATIAAEVFPGGLVFVDLAPITDPALVVPTIVQAIGLRLGDAPLAARLTAVLRDRRLLLILDNFEQVVEAAPVVTNLLGGCSGLTILVTSRVRLRVAGEREYVVPPLGVPAADGEGSFADVSRSDAVRLFVARAHAVQDDFALTPKNASVIAAICRRLDGLPLAIELAAVRVKVLEPSEMLFRLERRLPLLTGGGRDLPARQRTMRDAIAWSYDLLASEDQTLLRRLAVFVGGFSLEAAEAAISAFGNSAIDVFEGLTALVENSLVGRQPGLGDESRYAVFETVREFAWDRLAASGEEAEVRRAHADWFRRLGHQFQVALDAPTDQARWLRRMQVEQANLRAALASLLDRGAGDEALKLAVALLEFWRRGDYREGRDWLDRALAHSTGSSAKLRSEALYGAGLLALDQGDLPRAAALAAESQAAAHIDADAGGVARAAYLSSFVAEGRGDHRLAASFAEDALTSFRRSGDPSWIVRGLLRRGITEQALGNLTRATALYEEALTLAQRQANVLGVAPALVNLGKIARINGDIPRAVAITQQSLALSVELRDLWLICEALSTLAELAGECGQAAVGARLFGAEEALRESVGLDMNDPARVTHAPAIANVRANLGDQVFASSWTAGRELPLAEVLAEALALTVEPEPDPALGRVGMGRSLGLTQREREVLDLLVEGRSNPEIADALFITRRTVTSHVEHIFAKLGVRTRAAAANSAREHGLI